MKDEEKGDDGKNVGMPDDNTVFLLNFDKEPIHDMLGKSVSKEGSVTILSNGRFKSCGQFGNGVLLLDRSWYANLISTGYFTIDFGYILMKEMNHYYSVAPKQETV